MSQVEKLAKLVLHSSGRYLNPDPLRPIKVGSFGRVKDGLLRKEGELASWFTAKHVAGMSITEELCNIKESSVLKSSSVTETNINLNGKFGMADVAEAKFGIELAFTGDDQFYFHVPGLHFIGIKELWQIGAKLVDLAKLDSHDPQFWEDDYAIVTGIYCAKSALRVMAEQEGGKVAFTAKGAGTIDAMYEVGADLSFLSKSGSSTMLMETYKASTGECVLFYELGKVHWDIWGNKWWRVTTSTNP